VQSAGWEERVTAALLHAAPADDEYRIEHTLQVTSYGGSGTTALIRHFTAAELDLPKSPDHFPFKHTPAPPSADEVPEGFRVVYVYADPRDAVVSLFRRGLQVGAYRIFHLVDAPPEVEARLQTLDAYVAAGVDDYALQQHVENWLQHPPGYPVLFLRFDALPDCWPEVRDFVGLPASAPCLDIRPRRSPLHALDETTQARLTAMYQGVLDRLASLPPVHVVG
jgi:hypothetical protein